MNTCNHSNTETRMMISCSQIKKQCLDCGHSVGNAIKHENFTPDEIKKLPQFDLDFREKRSQEIWQSKKFTLEQKRIETQQKQAQDHAKYKQEYHDYLSSAAWQEKRKSIISRDNGLCQGCLSRPIHDIHHLTYDNIGDELLFQLIGLCRPCHERIHNEY